MFAQTKDKLRSETEQPVFMAKHEPVEFTATDTGDEQLESALRVVESRSYVGDDLAGPSVRCAVALQQRHLAHYANPFDGWWRRERRR